MIIDSKLAKEIIAKRVAKEFKNGQIINLGIGLPTLVANYVPKEVSVTFQSENGIVGMGQLASPSEEDYNLTNAGAQCVTVVPGGAFFDSAMSFALIRGGHIDITVLGALEVDEKGDLANWIIPGKMVPGMGGAMDLVSGAKKVIIAMQHTGKGKPKILKRCKLPLTAMGKINLIVTELCVLEIVNEVLILKEIHKDTTIEEIRSVTEADFIIGNDMKIMEV